MTKILLVEDDKNMAALFQEYLSAEGYDIVHVSDGADALYHLNNEETPNLVLLDLKLPDMDGFDILEHINKQELETSVVIVTGQGAMNTAIKAMQMGACDFVVKPTTKERFVCTVSNAIEIRSLTKTVKDFKKKSDKKSFHGFIGESLPMQSVYRIIESAADSKATVFITGESGTGKEVCADAIHQHSDRRKKPLCAINCGAIPHNLMESEIFGHVKGAFTGAHSDHEGAASRANGGTLFLDEICEMDLDLQTKLLRFIQTGRFQKVGGKKEEEVDVRFVCATNKDPMEYVKAGKFREDLYYRLHVLPISMPALCEREEDVILIAKYFLKTFVNEEKKDFEKFDNEVLNIFRKYKWPGNVRQLQNVVRNIVVLNKGDTVSHSMLPAPLNQLTADDCYIAPARVLDQNVGSLPSTSNIMGDDVANIQSHLSPEMAQGLLFGQSKEEITPLDTIERQLIEHTLRLCNQNVQHAAHYLGVSTATIYRKKSAWDKEKA